MGYKHNIVMTFRRGDGAELTAGTDHSEYKIYKADGLTGLPYAFTTAVNPQVAGVALSNMRAEPRNISIEFDCVQALRDHAISFFNPIYEMVLTVEWNGVKRWIAGRVRPVRVVTRNIYDKLTLGIELFCPDSYWNDMSNYGKDISFRRALMAFPFVMLRGRGMVPSYRAEGNEVTIENAGDAPVPIRVVVEAQGTVSNPRITLNGGAFIQINAQMTRGDVLDVSTDPRGIYVKLNGESVLNRSDRRSMFFQLPVGESVLAYEAIGESDALAVVVYYTPRFLGV